MNKTIEFLINLILVILLFKCLLFALGARIEFKKINDSSYEINITKNENKTTFIKN